jgi:hypothetical protein
MQYLHGQDAFVAYNATIQAHEIALSSVDIVTAMVGFRCK